MNAPLVEPPPSPLPLLPHSELAQLRAELTATRAHLQEARAGWHDTKAALSRERAHFHSVFEGMGEGLLITDLDDRIEYANGGIKEICGFSQEELVGQLAYELLLPRTEWPALKGRNERRTRGESDVYEVLLQGKQGQRVWVLIHATPLRDAKGEVVGTIGAIIDITQRKRAELALKQSEERLRGIIEHAVDGFVVHDFDGKFLEVNAQICASLDFSRDELIGKNVEQFEENADLEAMRLAWSGLRGGTKRATVNGRQKRRDGTTFPVEIRIGSIQWNGSEALLALVRDVSGRERRELARRELEARFKSVVGAASDAIVLTNGQGRIMLWNEGARKIFGWTEEEALERDVASLMPERFRGRHQIGITSVSQGQDSTIAGQVVPLVGLHKNGHEFPIEMSLGLWRDGHKTFYASVMRDVSERESLQRELQHALSERRLIMEAVPDVLFRLDLEGKLVAWNRELEVVTGLSPTVLQDRPAVNFFQPQHHGPIMDAIVRSLQGEQVEVEAPILHVDGHDTPFSFAAVPLRDDAGTLLGLVGTGRDISERLKVQEQTTLALREKEVLLKEIHHRVKNNLQIINSLLSMQAEALGDARVKAAFAESQHRIRAMALIHEALYLAGDLGRIDVRAYCTRLTGALARGYGETVSGVRIYLDVPDKLFLPLDAAVPCGLIINELVTNSFKYGFPHGRAGTISIQISRDQDALWTLRVGDDGIGIPDFDVATVSSTGLQLVTGLCDQLEGQYRVERNAGTQWTISFMTP